MKKIFVLLSLFLLFGCASNVNSKTQHKEFSYNVNVYDADGNWFETGLMIEAYDKVYIKLSSGQYELDTINDGTYRFVIKGENLYVK